MSKNYDSAPDWFKKGMECVANAPSARNTQLIVFEYTPDGVITENTGSWTSNKVDHGIAQYHFELGSGKKNNFILIKTGHRLMSRFFFI